jgi:hypothetical protein
VLRRWGSGTVLCDRQDSNRTPRHARHMALWEGMERNPTSASQDCQSRCWKGRVCHRMGLHQPTQPAPLCQRASMLLNSEHICMRLCGMQRIFASAKCVRTTLSSIRSRSLYASEDMRLLYCRRYDHHRTVKRRCRPETQTPGIWHSACEVAPTMAQGFPRVLECSRSER